MWRRVVAVGVGALCTAGHQAQAAAASSGCEEDGSHEEGHSTALVEDWNSLVIITTAALLVFQMGFRKLDRMVKNKRYAREIVETLYRELSVLGLVAFVLFAFEAADLNTGSETAQHLFEWIHITLSVTAMLYAIFIGLIVLLSRQISRHWDVYEDLEVNRYRDLCVQLESAAEQLGMPVGQPLSLSHQIWVFLCHPLGWRRYRHLNKVVKYHELKTSFIASNHLPRNFRFATYLKKCMQHVSLELVEITEEAWVALAWIVALHLYITGLFPGVEAKFTFTVLHILSGSFILFVAIIVYVKVTRVQEVILHSDMIQSNSFRSNGNSAAPSQKTLFWFSNPGFLIAALQCLQFLLAVNVAILLQFNSQIPSRMELIGSISMVALGGITYLITLPHIMPAYTMITHVGEMVDRRHLSEALVKQQRSFHRSARPPTLRQATLLAQLKHEHKTTRGRVQSLLEHPRFVSIMSWLIVVDFFIIAINGREFDVTFTPVAYVSELVLMILFLIEASLTIYARGPCSILRFEDPICSLDILVVLASFILLLIVGLEEAAGGPLSEQSLHAAQIIVLLRLVRYSRLLRVVIAPMRQQQKVGTGHGGGGFGRSISGAERARYVDETRSLLRRQTNPKALNKAEGLAADELHPIQATALEPLEAGVAQLPKPASPPVEELKEHQPRQDPLSPDSTLTGESRLHQQSEAPGSPESRAGLAGAVVRLGAQVESPLSPLEPRQVSEPLVTKAADARATQAPLSSSGSLHAGLGRLNVGSAFASGSMHNFTRHLFGKRARQQSPRVVDGVELQHSTVHGQRAVSRVSLTPQQQELSLKQKIVTEMWEATCREHPDITALHGKLGGPILRLMLGMQAFEDDQSSSGYGSGNSRLLGHSSDHHIHGHGGHGAVRSPRGRRSLVSQASYYTAGSMTGIAEHGSSPDSTSTGGSKATGSHATGSYRIRMEYGSDHSNSDDDDSSGGPIGMPGVLSSAQLPHATSTSSGIAQIEREELTSPISRQCRNTQEPETPRGRFMT